ncbi:sulfurtransferase complex subunit TusC [Shewanella sp. OMA3-2]|uniref:sulfurtransferase complex subunit TusC n=1 Tax=Shewanella sp. OMA3-2 TaxID=2908650 RepID=UPI001F1D3529|nr:sulfurtransferase complex subunit TusC [Shewanella sp. OMA3-2]UJF20819.1 sulfurtransferase complex subunit TusC [Shewanella sp. OMA3-2]
MKQICIVFRHAPYGTTYTREGIDFSLLSASFEQLVSLIFCDEAVLHLLPDQQAELAGSKDYVSVFKAFYLYEIETVMACEQSLNAMGLTVAELAIDVQSASVEAISAQLALADEVLVF